MRIIRMPQTKRSRRHGGMEHAWVTETAWHCVVHRTFVTWTTLVTKTTSTLRTFSIVCVQLETTGIVSTHLKLIQVLVVHGWVSPMSEISDPMSAGTSLICKNFIANIIHLLVVTQPDVRVAQIKKVVVFVKLRQGSGKDRQGMAVKAKGLKA